MALSTRNKQPVTNPKEEALEDPISEHSAETPRQTTADPDETPNLAQAILLLTKEFSNRDKPKKAKAKELHRTALEYFEPSILDSDGIPDWKDSWSELSALSMFSSARLTLLAIPRME